MSSFDIKAAGWDNNPVYLERSKAIADALISSIPIREEMTAIEYGAGTGITSFLLKDSLREITLMDNSTGMLEVTNEKIRAAKVENLKALKFDLEHDDYTGARVDLIISQMVLHHISDIVNIIRKFHGMLNPGGFLAIADLYSEDGSFHGEGFTGHNGFNPDELSHIIAELGFKNISHRECFVMHKVIAEGMTKQFRLFLLTAER
jgi:2-polyprenyl-3-methyl-5-hydroxy-6-metoxy-1,4-benzoquinol methylase